ncbi:MAG TPA: hypothetical protein PLU22_26785, partial [Polyangiaceae bacterium]|nr:hypothetical protein [Polyangiaceae bacterium]
MVMGSRGRSAGWRCGVLSAAVVAAMGCGGGEAGEGGDGGGGRDGGSGGRGAGGAGELPVEPVALDAGAFTYALTEGTAALPLWTTPP